MRRFACPMGLCIAGLAALAATTAGAADAEDRAARKQHRDKCIADSNRGDFAAASACWRDFIVRFGRHPVAFMMLGGTLEELSEPDVLAAFDAYCQAVETPKLTQKQGDSEWLLRPEELSQIRAKMNRLRSKLAFIGLESAASYAKLSVTSGKASQCREELVVAPSIPLRVTAVVDGKRASPEMELTLSAGQSVKLRFTRKDPATVGTLEAIPTSTADCRDGLLRDGCRLAGLCSFRDGQCIVASDADCRLSEGCSSFGFCTACEGVCCKPTTSEPPPPQGDKPRGHRLAIGLLLGGGGVTLPIGIGYGVHAMQNNSKSSSYCAGGLCLAKGVSLNSDAKTSATVSTVLISVGATAIATAIIIWIYDRVTRPRERKATQVAADRILPIPPPQPRLRTLAGGL